MFELNRYDNRMSSEWNAFIERSINGTFLFDRNYMDYHSDRFTDHSLVFSQNGIIRAVLPANIRDHVLYSHEGLTYGGLLVDSDIKTLDIVSMFESMKEMLKDEGIRYVEYKPVPWIYHSLPAESDLYAIFKVFGARLDGRLASSAVSMKNKQKFSYQRHRGVNKAIRNGLVVKESDNIDAFYTILDNNLMANYSVHPVHSNDEIHLLMGRFPKNIRLYMVFDNEKPIAGSILYITPEVVHTQYISASEEGKEKGALDLLFNYLINNCPFNCNYFDFGCSTEDMGFYLNKGLIHQKEGFGARGICYDIYGWNI